MRPSIHTPPTPACVARPTLRRRRGQRLARLLGALASVMLAGSGVPGALAGGLPDRGQAPPADLDQATAGGEVPAAEARSIVEYEWLPAHGRGPCGRRGRRRYCDGPRRALRPVGEAAEIVERLGLADARVYAYLTVREPAPELVDAVRVPRGDGLLWPVTEGFFGRGFGYVRRRELRHRIHKGVDITAPEGAPIRAATGGLVVYADNGISGYGNFVMILDAEGGLAAYAHCRALYVSAGQQVEQGAVIAEVGRTGLAPAPHLHFEWREAGHLVDPEPLFVERPDPGHARVLRCAYRKVHHPDLVCDSFGHS